MAEESNQVLLRNELSDRSSRLSSILKNNQIPSSVSCAISNRFSNSQSSASTNHLPNEDSSVMNTRLSGIISSLNADRRLGDESGVKHNRLPSSDSGVSCKCNHYSCSSTEEASNWPDDKQETNSRKNDETRRKSVSFCLGSSTNLTDKHLYVTDIEIDSDLETDSDLIFVSTESTSAGQRNGDYGTQENNYTSTLSRGSARENAARNNNTILKRTSAVYSEPDGNRTMYSRCNSCASQMNTMSTIPNRSKSYNTDFRTDQISVLQHQQLPVPPCSTTNQGQHNFPQCLQCACHDHSHSNVETIHFRSHPSIYREVDQNFDPQSTVRLLDDRLYIESRGPCATSQESRALQRETQTSTTIARSAVSNKSNNKVVDEESAVSVPRSCCTKKAIKTCLIMLVVFNIIFLAAIGFVISMHLNHHTYQECPLCKDVMDQMKGGNINDSTIQDYFKENDKDGRCCLDYAFVLKLVAQTKSNPPEPKQDKTNLGDTIINIIRNATEKAAIHLQSIPFISELSGGVPVQTRDSIRWNFKDKIHVGNFWDNTDSDTEIKIPLTGVYYIYAMVQYLYINANSTKRPESMQTFEEFPLSVSLYKSSHSETMTRSLYKSSHSETMTSRIGTVTLHCTFASQSIEHNNIIQKIVQLTKGDKVSVVVSNKQFLNNKQNMHQIGIFKVN